MKGTEYLQNLYTTYSDPELVANAFEEYYRRVYERISNTVNEIIQNEEEQVGLPFIPIPICIDQSTTYYCDKQELMNIFAEFNRAVEFAEIESEEYQVTIHDLQTDKDVTLDLKQIASSFGDSIDSCYLTWQGFKSVASQSVNAAQDFYNAVSLKVNQSSSLITNTATSIYSVLSNTANSITEKLSGMASFVGLENASTNPSQAAISEVDLGQYTGINPIAAWIGGMDWLKAGAGIIASNFNFQIATIRFTYNCLKMVFKGVYSAAKKIFSWVGNWFLKTFIDPVDYKCSDDILEYFKIPAKAAISLPYSFDGITPGGASFMQPAIDIINQFNKQGQGDGTTWFSQGGLYYRVLPTTTDPYYNEYGVANLQVRDVLLERYVKPLNLDRLYDILGQYISVDGDGDLTGYEHWTFGDIYNIIKSLSEGDLSYDKKTPEREVYYGTLASLLFSQMLFESQTVLMTNYATLDADNHLVLNSNDLISDINFNSDYHSNNALATILVPIIYGLAACYALAGRVAGNLSASDLNEITLKINGISVQTSHLKASITNADFLTAITSWSGTQFTETVISGESFFSASDVALSVFNSNYGYHDGYPYLSNINTYGNLEDFMLQSRNPFIANWWYYYYFFPIAGTSLLLFASREVQSGTDYDGAYVPYIVGRRPNFKMNVDIVTDQAHSDAIMNFVRGAMILAVTVAVGIAVGSVICSIVKKYKQVSFTRDTIAFNYGDALSKGHLDEAEALYKSYTGYNMKANILSLGLGKTSSVAGSAISDIGNKVGVALSNNQDVINLIKSSAP